MRNGGIRGTNVIDEVTKGYGVEPFGRVVKGSVVDVIDSCGELVMCNRGDDEVRVPRLVFGKICSSRGFASWGGGGCIEGILGRCCCRDVEVGAVALGVENRILEETKVAFAVSPRARNGHEVGGEFLLENA